MSQGVIVPDTQNGGYACASKYKVFTPCDIEMDAATAWLDRGAIVRGPGILRSVETGAHPGGGVFVAADVHYLASGGARAAAVVAADAAFSRLAADRIALVPGAEPYQPGQFYLRELPPLRAVLDGLAEMALPIIDGYADLDPGGRPGLGSRAREQFGVPVIGVAKSAFRTATHAIPVRRGTSVRPLYVRPLGCPAPTPPTWSGAWPASTGCPTPCVAPIASPAMARRNRRDAE